MADPDIIETIRTYARDVEETSARIRILRERRQEVIEGARAFDEVEAAKETLLTATTKLRHELMSDGQYNYVTESLAAEREKLKDQKEILSSYLLEHFRSTGERQIELSTNDAREVIVSGKLGKEIQYQTNLFTEARDGNA